MFKSKRKDKSNAAQVERATERLAEAQTRHELETDLLRRLRSTPLIDAKALVEAEEDVRLSYSEVRKAKMILRRARERDMSADQDRVR